MTMTDPEIKPKGGIAPLKNVAALMTLAQRLIHRPSHLPGIGVFHGFSGYGKTQAATWVQNKTGAIRLEIGDWWTPTTFAVALMKEIGVPEPKGPRWRLIEDAIGHLAQPGHPPLIIDEADQVMSKGFIETIRQIHEATKVPILLVGEERLPAKLKASERTHNRVLDWVAAQSCDAEDARLLADTWVPAGYSISAPALERVRRDSQNKHRLIAVNLERMTEWCRVRGLKELDAFNEALASGEPVARAPVKPVRRVA